MTLLMMVVGLTLLADASVSTSTASADCWSKARAPRYDAGTIKGWGKIQCSARRTWIQVIGRLYRNGELEDTDSSYCTGVDRCHVTPTAPNRSGNQVWCMYVEGHYGWGGPTSGREVAPDAACEHKGFFAETPIDIAVLDPGVDDILLGAMSQAGATFTTQR